MTWGSLAFGSLPAEGTTETVEAHPRVTPTTTIGLQRTLALHAEVVPFSHLTLMSFIATASAVDGVTVLYTVDPALVGTVTFTVSGPGDPTVLGYTVQMDGSYLVMVLGLIPLQAYTIAASNGLYAVPAEFDALAGTTPSGYKILEALTYAAGKQLQALSGQPGCVLRANLDVFDTTLYVSSTLGFPEAGWIRLGGLLLEYVSKTSQSFTLRTAALRYPLIPQGAIIFLATDMVTPDGAGFGTESH